MAGHSKWKQIKRKKAVTDAKRGAAFTKLIREITIAAKEGGGDATGNARLRVAIETAKAQNMPADNIERAIKKGTGELEGVIYEEVTYEGYGPSGVAIMVEATTDNANRTVAAIRHLFSRHGGNLGSANSVAWMFEGRGHITVEGAEMSEDTVLEAALEAGALDVSREGDHYLVSTEPADLHAVAGVLKERGVHASSVELALMPKTVVRVEGRDAERVFRLLEALDDLDDVARVHSNFDIDAQEMLEVGG
jgi:YebC/PmpR family DNA-binding regulatory protein